MQTILNDLKTAAGLFVDMRKARKRGGAIRVEKKVQIPVIQSGGFYSTVEGCALDRLDREVVIKAQGAFDALPDEVKRQLQFAPKSGEYKGRADLWRAALRPVMDDKQYHIAMNCIIARFVHIKQMRLEKGGAA